MLQPSVQVRASESERFETRRIVRIVELGQISAADLAELTDYVKSGGVALISGVPDPEMSWCGDEPRASTDAVLSLAGLRAGWHDPVLASARPAIIESGDLLFPLRVGDGLLLGRQGLGHGLGLEVDSATPMAWVYRDQPEKSFKPVIREHPAIARRTLGRGAVYFTSFSLARVAHCYPAADGQATDCSAAASSESLMRLVLGNILWSHAQLQWPIARQSPGGVSSIVAVTGDVHVDPQATQIKAALRLAEIMQELDIPVTFFVVGEVAERFPDLYGQLKSMPNVGIGTHSARGQQYRLGHSIVPFRRRGGVHGSEDVLDDVRQSERVLGLPHWPSERPWLAAVRTEAWGSNQTESEAWSGMKRAGISLVLDHNVDTVTSHPAVTPPRDWLETTVRKRVSIPAFSRNIQTATDNFRAPEQGLPQMFTLPSPQPDPCCNLAARFADYLGYVVGWHEALIEIGSVTGATQVWLWHPSTPAVQGAFDELRSSLQQMANDDRVRFSGVHELATWNANRHSGSLEISLNEDRSIESLQWRTSDSNHPAALPPGSHPDSSTVSYWVHGDAKLDGWSSYRVSVGGRIITVLTQPAKLP
jgi:hypothetical protein